MSTSEKWVGRSIERFEDEALLTGQARFMDDLEPVAGLCYAAILRSPHSCAEILSIDVEAARKLPGVIEVLTPDDVVAMSKPIGNLISRKLQYYPCAVKRARYFGEPVAVVIAEDRYIAEDALDLVVVKYEPKAAVVDPEDALSSSATVLHEEFGSNVVHERTFQYGDPEAQFAKAAKVVACKVNYPRVNSTPIETYGVIADFDASNGRYTVWSNFQGPFALHPIACDALRVKGHQLRLISPPSSGGSFGIKQGVYPYIVLLALAARKAGRPVKWIEDRLEHLAASSASTGRVTTVEGAFDAEGHLLALRLSQLENVGAYLRPPDPAALYRMHSTLSGPYRIRHISVDNKAVVTNQVPSGLNRGFGGPQFYYPLERMMDLAAAKFGMDAAELRLRNVVRSDEFPYDTVTGSRLESGDYRKCIEAALERAGYPQLLARREQARRDGKHFGIGIALAVETSASNMAYVNLALTHAQRLKSLPKSGAAGRARVIMDPLGSVIVHIDSVPNGQGHRTVMAQVVADEIGVLPEDVEVVSDLDTFGGAWSITSGNYSNRFSTVVTSAAKLAGQQAARKLRAAAAKELGVDPDQVQLVNGMASAPGGKNEPIQIRRLAMQLHWDAGNLLNPAVVEGQVRGGFAHGFGAGMLERVTYAADGTLLSGTFQDYMCPTAPELPDVDIVHVITPSPNTLHGAKGLGDGCSMLTPVTLANAIADATGIKDLTPPFLPGRLWHLMRGEDPDAFTRKRQPPETGSALTLKGALRGDGTVAIDAPRQQVWDTLLDPAKLKSIIPGCESIDATGPETFIARVRVNIAGIGGLYDTKIRIFDRKEPQSLRLSGRGESKLGLGEGEAFVTLKEDGGGGTVLSYEYSADVGGRVAAFGQRMLDGVVRILLASFFDRLRAYLRGETPSSGLMATVRGWFAMLQMLRGPK